MADSLTLWPAVVVFAVAAAAVWIAGVQLSRTSDIIEHRLGLGEALGGLILLAIVTDLPEIAIVASAARSGNLEIAVGNIFGGVAIQTVVLVLLDVIGLWKRDSLTHRAASLVVAIEGIVLLAILVVVVMGTQLQSQPGGGVEIAAALIVAIWLLGLWLVGRARRGLPWHDEGTAPGAQELPRGHAKRHHSDTAVQRGHGTARIVTIFAVAALVTLAGGVVLEQSGEAIARGIHMTGVIFGATVLAAATALPEVSTGLTAVWLGDYQMAVSDIFGGNAFLPVLLLPAGLLTGHAVLPGVHASDLYLTGLGALLTTVYLIGIIFRPRRQIAGMGIDSAVVLVTYVLGVAGLVWVVR